MRKLLKLFFLAIVFCMAPMQIHAQFYLDQTYVKPMPTPKNAPQRNSSTGMYIDNTYAPNSYSSPSTSSSSSSSSSTSSSSNKRFCHQCAGHPGRCKTCGGSGRWMPYVGAAYKTCPSCNGSGQCRWCNGTGYN